MYAFGLCDEVREPGENPRRLETKSDRGGALEFRGRSANYMHRSTICKHMNNINYFADSGKQKVRTRICILKDQKFWQFGFHFNFEGFQQKDGFLPLFCIFLLLI